MDPIYLASSIIAGSISGFASAWWGRQFRRIPDIIVSATGVREIDPDTSILLTSNEIVCLDNMTKETIPEEVRNISMSARKKAAKSLVPDDITRNLPREFKILLSMQEDKEEYYPVQLNIAKLLVGIIEESPSDDFAAHRFGQGRSEQKAKHEAIAKICQETDQLDELIKKIKSIDSQMGRAFEVMSQLTDGVTKEFIEKTNEMFNGNSKSPIMKEYDSILRKLKEQISLAEEKISNEKNFELPVLVTNTGHIPISIAKFSMCVIDNNEVYLPLECVGSNDVIVIPPSITQEVIFSSPKKREIPQTWDAVEAKRNILGTSAVVEIVCTTPSLIARSKPIPISLAHNFKSYCIKNALGKREIKQIDIMEKLGMKNS